MLEKLPLQNDTAIPSDEPLHLLCVDDDVAVLKSLTRVFRHEPFTVLTATSGREALTTLHATKNIGLILSDQRMPEMIGSAFLQEARKLAPDTTRIILTGYSDTADAINAINQGGITYFLTKPWDDLELLRIVREGLQHYQLIQENHRLQEQVMQKNVLLEEWNSNLKQRVLQQTALIRSKLEESNRQKRSIQQTKDALLLMFMDLLDLRHHQLSKHSRNVAALTESMMATLHLPPAHCEEIRTAALLHDIGLCYVSDQILDGCIPLKETAEYLNHSVKGEELLGVSEQLKGIGLLIRHHHEEYGGGGFPDGLAGEQIPLGSRIIHLASFMDHAYAQETGPDALYQVNCMVAAGVGNHFDPALLPAACQALREVLDFSQRG